MHDVVHFHGTYRYATRENLEHAISSARAVLADDDAAELDAAWMRCFVTRGTTLTVNLTRVCPGCPYAGSARPAPRHFLPSVPCFADPSRRASGAPRRASRGPDSLVDRFCAAAVFDLLAESAIEGAVEARVGDRHIDFFPSGRD
jgi:hypothetical protein